MTLDEKLNQLIDHLALLGAETTLMTGAIILLLAGLLRRRALITKALFLLTLFIAVFFHLQWWEAGSFLLGSLRVNAMGSAFSVLFLVASALLVLYRRSSKHAPEFYFFILSMLLGALILTKAGNLLIVYLAVELLSFCSYLLTTFSFKKQSFEAGIKYLLLGAVSSAIMVLGIGLLYGASGTLYLQELEPGIFNFLPAQVGLILMISGLFFKASVFPFHIWVPATYQSAPVDAVAFMSIVPKIAALLFLRELFLLGWFEDGSAPLRLVKVLGIVTMLVGTLGAFMQQNVRRMISFGAIAHTGFFLPFVFINSQTASEAFWYYAVVYVVMNMAIFYLIQHFERASKYTIMEYRGSGRNLFTGVAMTVVLVSLVGIPPLAGFTAKFFLFLSLWEKATIYGNVLDLMYLGIAVLVTIGSLFFYFRIPRAMYLEQPLEEASKAFLPSSTRTKLLATIFTLTLLLLFFKPELVHDLQLMLTIIHE